MLCPNCKLLLKEIELHGEFVDQCVSCHGLWFQKDELVNVLESINSHSLEKTAAVDRENRKCPNCDGPMRVTVYAYDSGVSISRCERCSGTWLDHGQLEQIANYRLGTPASNCLAAERAIELEDERHWRSLGNVIRSRMASACFALAIVTIAFAFHGPRTSFRMLFAVTLPLLCIWFCDAFGRMRGISLGLFRPTITQESPGVFVAIGGWLLMICQLFVIVFTRS